MSWYVVMTAARAEMIARDSIHATGAGVFLPLYRALVRHGRRVIAVDKPLFPRYVFADVPPGGAVGALNRAKGVATLVLCGDRPLPLTIATMQAMMDAVDDAGRVILPRPGDAVDEAPVFRVGETVRIVSGPFADVQALIRGVDGRGNVNLNLNVLGGETPATVPAASLELVAVDGPARNGRMRVGPRQ